MKMFANRKPCSLRAMARFVLSASCVLAGACLWTGAAAVPVASPSTVTAISGGTTGAYTLTYNIYNAQDQNGDYDAITLIDIPELNLGDLVFTNLPDGWSATEYSGGPFTVSNPKAANDSPYYVELFADTDATLGIGYDTSVSFVAQVPTPYTVNATFALDHNAYAYDSYTEFIDPPIPGAIPTTGVPEPSTTAIMGLGLLALAAARRARVPRGPLR
jgi:hypothetical protein